MEMKSKMKSNSMFIEQMKSVTSWFSTWSECEQTVALYSLLKCISPCQGHFLVQVLQNTLLDCQELKVKEEEANNSVYVSNLEKEPVERAVRELLAHLPLLHSGNASAKAEYLNVIPKVLSHSIENGSYIEECRQLLSYFLIHPAINSDERSQFTTWLGHLEERFTYSIYHNTQQDQENSSQDNAGSTSCASQNIQKNSNVPRGKLRLHTNGINSTHKHPPLQTTYFAPSNVNSVAPRGHVKERGTLSSQSSVSSSGSGCDAAHENMPWPARNSFLEEKSGMRDVPMWLKTLRLHKYAYLFQQLNYDEMLNISESWLESQKVTKGARQKILLSITQLNERQPRLRALEKQIMEGGYLMAALSEMENILATPIQNMSPIGLMTGSGDAKENLPPTVSPFASENDASLIVEGDIAGQFQRLMGKVCTQLLVSSPRNEECFDIYLHLIDKCISHEAFAQIQKLLSTWKQQAQSMNPNPGKVRGSLGNTFPIEMSPGNATPEKTARIPKPISHQWNSGTKRCTLGGTTSGHIPLQTAARSNLTKQVKKPLTKILSAPLRLGPFGVALPNDFDDMESTDTEINAQLDSLCLSMTEHALGGSDGNDKSCVF